MFRYTISKKITYTKKIAKKVCALCKCEHNEKPVVM